MEQHDGKPAARPTIYNPYRTKQKRQRTKEPSTPHSPGESHKTTKNDTTRLPAANTKKPDTIVTSTNESSASALVISAAFKAGMEGIDRAAIDAIILRESGHSKFMQQQRKRDNMVNDKIAKLRQKLATVPLQQFSRDALLESLVRGRCPRSIYCIVDMDMFYMACELLKYPQLRNVPACVGGSSMILTSNYVARKYGVRSAMPGYIGQTLVEELSDRKQTLHFCKPNFDLYKQQSGVFQAVLSEYDPNLKMYSLDEAYMNLTNYMANRILYPSLTHEQVREKVRNDKEQDRFDVLLTVPSSKCLQLGDEIVRELRERVKVRTGGLTCSAGLASNNLIAKIGSDCNKPNGQKIVGSEHQDVMSFLYPLSVRKISGIGRVTEKILTAFGVHTVQDLYDKRALVCFLFGDDSASTEFLLRACVGCSSSRGSSDQPQKGISRERTMNCKDWTDINVKLGEIAELLSSDMQRKNMFASTITLKCKMTDFQVYNRSRTVSRCIQAGSDLLTVATELLQEVRRAHPQREFAIRLLGIRCSNLTNTSGQTTLTAFLKSPPRSTTPPPTTIKSPNPYSPKNKKTRTSPSTDVLAQTRDSAPPSPKCPICNVPFPSDDWDQINRHIDACLNGSTIRELVRKSCTRSDDASSSSNNNSNRDKTAKKPSRQTLTHYFAPKV